MEEQNFRFHHSADLIHSKNITTANLGTLKFIDSFKSGEGIGFPMVDSHNIGKLNGTAEGNKKVGGDVPTDWWKSKCQTVDVENKKLLGN